MCISFCGNRVRACGQPTRYYQSRPIAGSSRIMNNKKISSVILVFLCTAQMVLAEAGDTTDHPALVGRGTVGIACMVAAFLLGIGLHEWAHAWAATQLGDDTPRKDGRLSLNPLDHLDPIGSLLMIVACVSSLPILGWGRAVSVEPRNFRNPREAMMKVALAGPLMNFLIAAAATLFVRILVITRELEIAWLPDGIVVNFLCLFICIAFLNLSLGVFNLIPVPPLDGSKVMAGYLPPAGAEFLQDLGGRSFFLLYVILRTGVLDLPFAVLDIGLGAVMRSNVISVALLAIVICAWWAFSRSLRDEPANYT